MKILLISLLSLVLFAGVSSASSTTPVPSLSNLGKPTGSGDATQKLGSVTYNLKCSVWDYDNGYVQKCVVIGYSSGKAPVATKTTANKLAS